MEYLPTNIPQTVCKCIHEYTSDKVGIHPTATLIKSLVFRQTGVNGIHWPDGHASTAVGANAPTYFINAPNMWGFPNHIWLRFCHDQYDERNFPQHFDISLKWDSICVQDEIEALVADEVQIYREGLPPEEPYRTYITHAIQWTKSDTGGWIANPPP